MSSAKSKRVEDTVKQIESGDFRLSDVESLLVALRFCKNEIVEDLANFSTHSGSRDRGNSYKTVKVYTKHILDQMEGGSIQNDNLPPVYTSREVIVGIITTLKLKGYYVNRSRLFNQREKIVNFIYQLANETELYNVDTRLNRSFLKRKGDGRVWLFMEVNSSFKNPVIKIANSNALLRISIPLFDV